MNSPEAKTNRLIGHRLRELRIAWGVTLMQLSREIGISYQALQKYEGGRTAITASRLMAIAEALGVPITHFFEASDLPIRDDEQSNRRTIQLLARMHQIERQHPEIFAAICEIAKALAKDGE